MKTMNIKSTDYRVQITESGSVPGSVLAAIRKASVLCTLCSVLLISSCTHDEIIPPVNTTNDALALLPGNTPVGVKAEITDNREQSTTTRAEGDESATTYYASYEIHADMNVNFTMYLPGASDDNNLQRLGTSTLNTLATTEPFSTLMLKDFNLTEGNYRSVSRWTLLTANNSGIDNLWGWARLTADATTGQPVLDYTMQRGNAKVTIVVQDENGQPVDVSGGKVTATVSLPKTTPILIYTPEDETAGKILHFYLQTEVKTLAGDEAIDPNRIALGTCAGGTENFDFDGMVTADGTGSYYYGEQNNTLTGIVSATATHTTDNTTFTPIEGGPQFTDTDKLTITVNTDPDGNGLQTTGTYSLKLSDVKLSDTENLTALEPGKHYTLTVTLRHNTLVAATATIGAWSTASANANIGGDGAFMPSYTYDAATNTYNVYQSEGIEEALKARTDENSTLVYFGTTVVPSGVVNDKIVVLSGATTDLATVQTAIAGKTHIIATGTELATYSGTATTVVGEAIRQLTIDENGATDANSELTSTISFVMPDATTIGDNAFNGCSALKTLTFGSSIKSLGTNAFSGINAEISYNGIPLKMEDGELKIDKVTGNNFFSDLPAIIANGNLCVVVDGTCGEQEYGWDDELNRMKIIIQSAIAKGVTRVYVTGTFLSKLQVHYGNQTVLGEAIEDFAIGTIDLIIPNVSSIPQQAFTMAPAIKSLTFGSVITSVGMGAFDDDYTPNCDLTLAKGQEHIVEYSTGTGTPIGKPNGTPVTAGETSWGGATWKSITLK